MATTPVTAKHIAQRLKFDWSDGANGAQDELEAIADAAATEALGSFGVSLGADIFRGVNQTAVAWARERGAELVGMRVTANGALVENPNAKWAITDGTRILLQSTIAQALDEGWSAGELREAILSGYTFSNARSAMIARTEVSRATNHSELIAARATGMGTKEWLAASDSCDECLANQEQGAISIDDDFDSGDPAPGAHPNCRCSATYSPAGADTEEEESAA